MKQKIPIPEQRGYHGYTTNGRPIPKRGSLKNGQYTQVQPASAAASQYRQWQQQESYDIGTEDGEWDTQWPQRMPTSSRRYIQPREYVQGSTRFHVQYGPPPQPAQPNRRQVDTDNERITESRREKGDMHWLVFFGVGMTVMLLLWVLGSAFLSWLDTKWDDMIYSYPRTFQCDAVVGHSDSQQNPSHFIAINLNRHVEVIELPGGDSSHSRIFMIATLVGDGQDLTPVTLSFKDVNRDGKPDMLIHIQDQVIVFINDNGQFRPQQPGDHIHL